MTGSMMNIAFDFRDSLTYGNPVGTFVLRVPEGIQSKVNLFAAFESAGRFPEYFGSNWDAFFDCLRDFEWIQEKKIVILHRDLPLSENTTICRIYLETLQSAIEDWTASATRSNIDDASADSGTHELVVVFPTSLRQDVSSVLFGHRPN
jgi:RNAse (barnase) inhibitor barstar